MGSPATAIEPDHAGKLSCTNKLVTCIQVARRERPDWVLGFNLVPHGINAYLSARGSGARSLYAMIGGPVEWRDTR